MNNKNKEINHSKRIVDLTQPSWQVKYSDYGGLKEYNRIKNLYWYISSYYIDKEGKYTATNFPLMGYNDDIKALLQFKKDLSRPIRTYETY